MADGVAADEEEAVGCLDGWDGLGGEEDADAGAGGGLTDLGRVVAAGDAGADGVGAGLGCDALDAA